MSSKAKQVRDLLKMSYLTAEFMCAHVVAEKPVIWFSRWTAWRWTPGPSRSNIR
jgi:hypothetical protein